MAELFMDLSALVFFDLCTVLFAALATDRAEANGNLFDTDDACRRYRKSPSSGAANCLGKATPPPAPRANLGTLAIVPCSTSKHNPH